MSNRRPIKLGLIADDLTGACDASVQFAKRGWTTRLVLNANSPDFTESDASSVVALTTDSRALSNAEAETITCDALLTLMRAGVDRVFLKIDSTMRGSVRGQIAGALAAWQMRHPQPQALVCPAYPRMGRTVKDKQLFVNGEPVERTAIGRDPVSPVRTSNIGDLITASASVSVVDAMTDDDLKELAQTIIGKGPSAIAVGSAGLSGALAEAWMGPAAGGPRRDVAIEGKIRASRILILVTSLNPVSHRQIARLNAAFPEVRALVAPTIRVEAPVAEQLATRFAELVKQGGGDLIGLVGGDGARAALTRLDASAIRIFDSLLEGIPLGVVVGGAADGVPVFTKAGGFGDEDALVRIVERVGR
jgi:uncharacterized protein YgbK (DUF1537 family)